MRVQQGADQSCCRIVGCQSFGFSLSFQDDAGCILIRSLLVIQIRLVEFCLQHCAIEIRFHHFRLGSFED